MKRKAFIAAAAAFLLSLAACGDSNDSSESQKASEAVTASLEDNTADPTEESSTAETTTKAPATTREKKTTEAATVSNTSAIKDGVWCGVDDSTSVLVDYRVFEGDMFLATDANYNVAMTFDYSIDGDKLKSTSSVGGSKSEAKIERISDEKFRLTSDDSTETYTWLKEGNIDDFQFFCNAQLEYMASRYYASRHNHTPEFVDVADDEAGKTVSIHMYDLYDGHTSTCDWYYVDRFTAAGKNILDEPIDINSPVPSVWSPEVSVRSQMSANDSYCAIAYLGYVEPSKLDYDPNDSYYRDVLSKSGFAGKFDFLMSIPKEYFACTLNGCELYLVIPRDDEAQVQVEEYDFVNDRSIGSIYRSYNGAPFLLKCNYSDISSDIRIKVVDNSGIHPEFSPYISLESGEPKSGNDKVMVITK
jgi:hypothetical protein